MSASVRIKPIETFAGSVDFHQKYNMTTAPPVMTPPPVNSAKMSFMSTTL
jgi:hypothetical protein